jgi:hypothetical protein
LFNKETAFLTPLDFRLTAAAQFRLLSTMCSLSSNSIIKVQSGFFTEQLVNPRAASLTSFSDQANALTKKFYASLDTQLTGSHGAQLFMTTIDTSAFFSALYTNQFETSVPGSGVYHAVPNGYPLYDNVTFNSVSF